MKTERIEAAQQKTANGLLAIWQGIRKQFVGEIPAEMAFCEFDCPKSQCRVADRETCPIRRRYQTMLAPAEKSAARANR